MIINRIKSSKNQGWDPENKTDHSCREGTLQKMRLTVTNLVSVMAGRWKEHYKKVEGVKKLVNTGFI